MIAKKNKNYTVKSSIDGSPMKIYPADDEDISKHHMNNLMQYLEVDMLNGWTNHSKTKKCTIVVIPKLKMKTIQALKNCVIQNKYGLIDLLQQKPIEADSSTRSQEIAKIDEVSLNTAQCN